MNRRLQALRAEHDRLRSAMEAIENKAADEGRDTTDEEDAELNTLHERAENVGERIAEVVKREDNLRASGEILDRYKDDTDPQVSGIRQRAEAPVRTPGDYAVDYFRAHLHNDSDARARLDADHLRAVDTQSISENLGIVPTPIVGDLIKFVDATRPVVNSMRELPMPQGGKTFTRPRVTQTTRVLVQSAEHAELTSRNMLITGDTVTKGTHGGVLNLSEQDIDWTDPALLSIVIEDLAEQYAIDTETTAATAIEAGVTTNSEDLSLTANSDAFYAALGAAAAGVYGSAKLLPDTLYASIDRWAYLLSLMDDTGRPLFPTLSPQNAGGTLEVTTFSGNPLGLRLVVGPAFSDGFFALAATRYLERFEQNKGLAQVAIPSNLQQQVAYRGYFATNVRPEGLVGLLPAGS